MARGSALNEGIGALLGVDELCMPLGSSGIVWCEGVHYTGIPHRRCMSNKGHDGATHQRRELYVPLMVGGIICGWPA